jgi:hypothetical protein
MKDHMSIGRGIAILGIWGAVAVIGWHDPESGVVAAIFGMVATFAAAESR